MISPGAAKCHLRLPFSFLNAHFLELSCSLQRGGHGHTDTCHCHSSALARQWVAARRALATRAAVGLQQCLGQCHLCGCVFEHLVHVYTQTLTLPCDFLTTAMTFQSPCLRTLWPGHDAFVPFLQLPTDLIPCQRGLSWSKQLRKE